MKIKKTSTKTTKSQKTSPLKHRGITLNPLTLFTVLLIILLVIFIGFKVWYLGTSGIAKIDLRALELLSSADKKAQEEAIIKALWEEVPPDSFIPTYSLEKEVYVYFIGQNQNAAFNVIKKNPDKIWAIQPYWYRLTTSGGIEKLPGAEAKDILEYSRKTGIQIYPSINNKFDSNRTHRILSTDASRKKHISNLINLVEKNNYNGLNIDYENIKSVDKAAFTVFIQELARQLHEKDKFLTIAVHAKTHDKGNWAGQYAMDYAALGEAADRVMIMTYDHSWGTSAPGNIAPVSWVEDVLNYAITRIRPEKILLGVHFYGYDWGYGTDNHGVLITYDQAVSFHSSYGGSQIIKNNEGEKFYTYYLSGKKHTVYFADYETVAPRLEIANKYKLSGIGIWRIGNEDQRNWKEIGERL